jgi:hypothetical protein
VLSYQHITGEPQLDMASSMEPSLQAERPCAIQKAFQYLDPSTVWKLE